MFARLMTASIALLVAAPAVSLAAVATTSYSAGDEGPNPRAVRIVEAEDGHLLTVNLADLEKGTRVHSARLRAARGKLEDAAGLLAEIEIFPGKAAAGPAYDAFDATEAVRQSLAAGGKLNLFVKTFPAWRQQATRLEVTYEGKPAGFPPAVRGLKVFHREGQTFITWYEVTRLAEATDACTYRIYRHTKPINADSILQAELLATVGPLSCWNVNGRNTEYLIGQAMIKTDEIGELARGHNSHMYTWA